MRPLTTGLVCISLAFANLSCSVNILETFANKNSNEALFEAATANINASNYAAALTNIGAMTGAFPGTARVLQLKASAYAGLCGFQFLTFAQAFGNMGATLLFPFLLQNFDAGVASNIDNCVTAQNIMESIGAIGVRSADQNLFIATVALAKIGNILSYYADVGHTGAVTAGFDACAVGGARAAGGPITDADAREIGTGLSLAIANLTAVAGTVNLGSGTVTALSSVCTTLSGVPGYDFCGVTDPTLLTVNEVKGIRSLVKENSAVGLGGNCAGSLALCNCP